MNKSTHKGNSTGCFFVLLSIISFPYFLVWIGLLFRLIEDGVIWYNAIIGSYLWPFYVIDLIYDDMLLYLLEMR